MRLVRTNLFILTQGNVKLTLKGDFCMMPLTFADAGKENIIKKVGGNSETRKFLENLGFVAGASVIIINEIGGNVIVNIKDSRVAVSKEMACKIMI